jgi:hypothetical protein
MPNPEELIRRGLAESPRDFGSTDRVGKDIKLIDMGRDFYTNINASSTGNIAIEIQYYPNTRDYKEPLIIKTFQNGGANFPRPRKTMMPLSIQ